MKLHVSEVAMYRFFPLLFCLLVSPASLAAQNANGGAAQDDSPAMFGTGDRPGLNYQSQNMPANAIVGQVGYEAAYDTDPLGVSSPSSADSDHTLSMNLLLVHQSARTAAEIAYHPYFEFFQKYTTFDRFNQSLSADLALKLSSHWSTRVRDSFSDQIGPYDGQDASIASPSDLNSTLYMPLEIQKENSSRVDLAYRGGPRTSLVLTGGYEMRNLSEDTPVAAPRYDTSGPNLGVEYMWRASEHLTTGVLCSVERIDLSGYMAGGGNSRMEIASALPTIGWRLGRSVEMEIFAGPEIIREQAPQGTSASMNLPLQARWAAGGTIGHKRERTALTLSAQHIVTDGGGILSFVTESSVDGGVRRKLHGQWDASFDLMFARNSWLSGSSEQASITTQSASFELNHPVGRRMSFHAGYDFTRQGSPAALDADFNRNRIIAGVSWQLRPIPFGR